MSLFDIQETFFDLFDIWETIFNLLELKSQLKLISTCKYFEDQFFIKKLVKNIRLSDDIIFQKKFSRIMDLDVSNNPKITNVSFMKNLKILKAGWHCGIDQNGIQDLDLVRFSFNIYNKKLKFNIIDMT